MITITQTPQLYTPSGRPIVFKATSDRANLIYFNLEVMTATDQVIASLRLFPTPASPTGVTMDLSVIMGGIVNTVPIFRSLPILLYDMPNSAREVKIKLTEVYVALGVPTNGSAVSSDLFTVFDADFERMRFHAYDYTDYTQLKTGGKGKFLTLRRGPIYTSYNGHHRYAFINNDDYLDITARDATITVWYNDGSTRTVTANLVIDADTKQLAVMDMSPKTLGAYMEGIEANVNFRNMLKYSVRVDANYDFPNTSLSETLVFIIRETCRETLNVFWLNEIGGIDSMEFVNPTYSNGVEHFTIGRGELNQDYTDVNGGLYANDTVTYGKKTSTSITAHTWNMSDNDSDLLASMVVSKQIYVQLPDGNYTPARIMSTTYEAKKQRYTTGSMIQDAFTFNLSKNILPNV